MNRDPSETDAYFREVKMGLLQAKAQLEQPHLLYAEKRFPELAGQEDARKDVLEQIQKAIAALEGLCRYVGAEWIESRKQEEK